MNNFKEIQSIYLALHEYNDQIERDKFNRYIPTDKDYWVNSPVVSKYLFENGFQPIYPGGKKFAVCISHDIDRLYEKKWSFKTLLNQQRKAIFKWDWKTYKNNFQHRKRIIHSDNDLQRWLDIEKKYGVKATYFFMSLMPGEEDFNYLPNEITSVLNSVIKNEHEVGLHGGHLAYKSATKMKREKELLEIELDRKIVSYRNHYLRFDIEKSWHEMLKAGFKYDSTFGHAKLIGFRNGMMYPFQFADKEKNIFDFYILPLQVMDGTLENYMKLSDDEIEKTIQSFVNSVESFSGVFTILWHNNNCKNGKFQLFENILKYLHEKDPWFATSSEIIDYYKSNNYFEQINHILKISK